MQLADLLEKVRDAMGPRAMPADVARALIAEALARPDAKELLMQAVFPWVHAQERTRVREAEKEALTGPTPPGNPVAGRPASAGKGPWDTQSPTITRLNPAQESMRAFLAQRCYVPNHGQVPWGSMTRELHEARVAYLVRLRDGFTAGTNATIRRHGYAIGLLAESGCVDLDEYAGTYGALPAELEGDEYAPA